jgi:hypothetical protein
MKSFLVACISLAMLIGQSSLAANKPVILPLKCSSTGWAYWNVNVKIGQAVDQGNYNSSPVHVVLVDHYHRKLLDKTFHTTAGYDRRSGNLVFSIPRFSESSGEGMKLTIFTRSVNKQGDGKTEYEAELWGSEVFASPSDGDPHSIVCSTL